MARPIVSTADTCGGSPRIDGTRLTCANVVLTLRDMTLDDYLAEYSNLCGDDIVNCLKYCSNRHCLDDHVSNFCQGCSLDTTIAEPCEVPNPPAGTLELSYTEAYENEATDVWKLAEALLRQRGRRTS